MGGGGARGLGGPAGPNAEAGGTGAVCWPLKNGLVGGPFGVEGPMGGPGGPIPIGLLAGTGIVLLLPFVKGGLIVEGGGPFEDGSLAGGPMGGPMGGPPGVITGRVAGGPGMGPKIVGGPGLIWDPLGTPPIESDPVGGGGPIGPGLNPAGAPMGGPIGGPRGKDETGF